MPHAVTHVLFAIVLVELIRDYAIKNKKKFPLHYVMIAGISAMIPDIDIFLNWFGIDIIHRTLTHSLIFSSVFLLSFFAFNKIKIKSLSKHRLKLNVIFLMIFIGIFTHIALDATLMGSVMPFYPFNAMLFGFNILSGINVNPETLMAGIDAAILIAWLIHEEIKHKISSFL